MSNVRGTCESSSATCRNKRAAGNAFPDRAVAKRIAKRMRSGGKPVVYYRCDFCGLWHIGTPRPVSKE